MQQKRVNYRALRALAPARVVATLMALSVLSVACAGRDTEETTTRQEESKAPVILQASPLLTGGSSRGRPSSWGCCEPKADVQPDPSLPLIEISASDGTFVPERLVVPAREDFQILLKSPDLRESHLLAIYPLQDGVPLLSRPAFSSEKIDGQAEVLFRVPALDTGKYLLKDVVSHASGEVIAEK